MNDQTSERSLIRRLMIVMFSAVTLVFAIAAVIFAGSIQRQANADIDLRLRAVALDLVDGLSFEPDGTPVVNRIPDRHEFGERLSGWYWQIKIDGETIARSPSLLLHDLATPANGGVTTTGPEGSHLRTASVEREPAGLVRKVVAQASAPQRSADEIASGELQLMAAGLIALLVSLVAVTCWLLARGLTPLKTIQHDLNAMISGSSRTLPHTGYRELDRMVKLINTLVDQGHAQIAAHRDAANKLAHALKTPLAMIAARTDAAGTTPDPDIQSSIAIMRSHIEHNLNRTRLAGAREGLAERVPLEPVVADLMFAFAHTYRDRHLIQTVDIAAGAAFLGDKDDLVELLGNLLDNAHRFAASRVALIASEDPSGLTIRIEDDGPGMTAQASAPGDQRKGLGLKIARAIVTTYGGTLGIESEVSRGGSGRGLAVKLSLRRPSGG